MMLREKQCLVTTHSTVASYGRLRVHSETLAHGTAHTSLRPAAVRVAAPFGPNRIQGGESGFHVQALP
jgi:hypothetical protein